MAGSYPDVLTNRMVLDRDGSALYTIAGDARTTLTNDDLKVVNNEASDDLGLTTDVEAYLLAFPELRDVNGLYLGFAQAVADDWIDVVVEGSSDTTTGLDGIWSVIYASNRVEDGVSTGWWGHTAAGDYRRYIRAIAPVTGLRALKIGITPETPGTTAWRLKSLHVFGDVSAEQNPHRLALWHPTMDMRMPGGHLDWGDVPFSSSAEKQFRVRNVSPRKRADAVVVSVDTLTDATPSVPPQFLLSYGGSAYAASVTIPSIAPEASSAKVTMRRVTPSTAASGAWAARVVTSTGAWVETLT